MATTYTNGQVAFPEDDVCAEAYDKGFSTGQDMVCMNDRPEPFANEDAAEEFIASMLEGEGEARQYSPFEFFAKWVNDQEDSSEVWDAYEKGVRDGIVGQLKEEGFMS